jgi:lysophospholipase L1-like esterase
MNIVCFGDSITAAGGIGECDRWVTILGNKLNDWKPGRFSVFNRGIGGNTTAQGRDRFANDVYPYLPGILLIEFGFNDASVAEPFKNNRVSIAEFKRNLEEFNRIAKANKSKAVFIVNHTILRKTGYKQFNGKKYVNNFKPYNPAIKAVAEKCKAPVIDLPEIMKKRKVDLKKFLKEDELHLSVKGNHIYADMVFEALKNIL